MADNSPFQGLKAPLPTDAVASAALWGQVQEHRLHDVQWLEQMHGMALTGVSVPPASLAVVLTEHELAPDIGLLDLQQWLFATLLAG